MTRLAHRAVVAALLAFAGASCAYAPPAASRPLPSVVWPAPPAAPALRLAAVFPDPGAPAPRRSRLRAVLDFLAGTDGARKREPVLVRPFGIAALPGGSFLVADPDRPAVLRVEADGRHTALSCKGRPWVAPMAVDASPEGSVWVADGGAGEVVRIGGDGACRAIGKGALERPTGLAVLGDRVYVVDPPRHAVVALSLDGTEAGRWGTRGDGDGQLHFPSAIARTAGGTLLVVDALNFRIARFSPEGRWLGAFGDVARPKGVAVDAAGRIYVSDAQRDLVLRFTPEGVLEAELGAGGGDPGHFTLPAGVSSAGGRLLVADSHNQRVQVFEIL